MSADLNPGPSGTQESRVEQELVDLLFGAMPMAMGISAFLAITLAVTEAGVVGWIRAGSWLGLSLLISVARLLQTRAYVRTGRSPADPGRWVNRFCYLALAGGAVWGLAAVLLFTPNNASHQAFLAFVIAGTSAGAVTTLAPKFQAATAFLVPTLLPLAIRFFMVGGQLDVTMGGLTLLFLASILLNARRIGESLRENVVLRLETVPREAALKQKAQLLRQTGALARVGGWEWERDTRELRWAEHSYAIQELLGEYSPSIESTLQFFETDVQPTVQEAFRAAVQEARSFDLILPLLTPMGQRRWIHLIGEPDSRNGRVVKVTGAFQDVTALRESEEALRAHIRVLERLQAITSLVQVPYANRVERLLDLGREVLDLDVGVFSMLKGQAVHAEYFVGFSTAPLACDSDEFAPLQAVRTGAPVVTEKEAGEHLAPYDLLRWVASPVTVDRLVSGMLIFGSTSERRDVLSEGDRSLVRLLAQGLGAEHERQQSHRIKEEFVSTVSHELRTPLTSIGGSLSLLQSGAVGALPDEASDLVEMAQRNSDRLGVLINDLLDMEKIASGILEFEMGRHDLATLIERSVSDLRGFGSQHGVSLRVDDDPPRVEVAVDEGRIHQVLSNLLSNAAKFSPEGAEVRISIEVLEAMVRVSVQDDGPGIPFHLQDHIFEKFTQADSSDRREKGGTGLGLAITRTLIERMGGQIHVRSNPGEGTTFYFELPIVPAS